MTTLTRSKLSTYLDELLNAHAYTDYGPNGLQIEGREQVSRVAFAVSATKESIAKAVEWGAHALVVHHGLFWRFHGVRTITGPFASRVKPLIEHNINLLGYHLPLDAHLEVGNAATLAKKLNLQNLAPFGDYKGMSTGVHGALKDPLSPQQFQEHLTKVLDHPVLHSCPNDKPIKTMGIITGGANGDWHHSLRLGLDAYLTGEMSEHDWHEAKESGIHMFAGGHHATEKYGVQALQAKLVQEYKIESLFIDSLNPA